MEHNKTKQAEIDEINKQMEQLANELEENPQKFGDEAYRLAMESIFDSNFINNAENLDDLKHNCNNHLELRERRKGPGTAYACQCQVCGDAKGGEVSKKNISIQPPPFDTTLSEAYQNKHKKLLNPKIEEQYGERKSILKPSTIQPLHELLGERLEGLVKELESEYPHANITQSIQTYLIRQRAKIVNSIVPTWISEDELKEWFKQKFSEWFYIKEEVWGEGYVDRCKKKVRVDFVLKAKGALISNGFTEDYIGVEVKFFDPRDGHGFHGKSSRGIFQALSYWYSGAKWNIVENQSSKLATVLLFSNLSFLDEKEAIFNTYDSYYRSLWRSYLSIANHANVGELQIQSCSNENWGWGMEYCGAKYFSKRSDGSLVLGNENVINKIRIGNSKNKTKV